MKIMKILYFIIFFLNSFLFADLVLPPLVKDGEKYENVSDFFIQKGHQNYITSIAFSKGSKYFISASGDNTIRVWDRKSFKLIHILKGHNRTVTSICYSKDFKYIISASWDKTIRVWDANTFKEIAVLEGHKKAIRSVIVSEDSKYIISASEDKTIKIWDIHSFNLIKTLKGNSSPITSVVSTKNFKYLISASIDGSINIWDAKSFKLLKILNNRKGAISSIAISNNSKYLASSSSDSTIEIWDMQSFSLIKTLEGHSKSVFSVQFSKDSNYLLSASYDKTIKIWDIKNFNLIKSISSHDNEIYVAKFSEDFKYIISGGADNALKIWNLKQFDLINTIQNSNTYITTIFNDSDYILSGTSNGYISVWNIKNLNLTHRIKAHKKNIDYLLKNNKYIVSTSDNLIKLWDLKSGKLIQKFEGHKKNITSIQFFSNSKYLISTSKDHTIKIWDLKSGNIINSFENNTSINAMTLSKKFTIIGTEDGNIKILKNETLSLFKTLKKYTKPITALCSNKKFIVSLSNDNIVKIWDIKTFKLLKTLENNSSQIKSIKFSNDNKYLISTSSSDIIFWDTNNFSVAFSWKVNNNQNDTFSSYLAMENFNNIPILFPINNRQFIIKNQKNFEIKDMNTSELILSFHENNDGNWIIFNERKKLFFRGDNGNYLYINNNHTKNVLPLNIYNRDNLEILLPKEIVLKSNDVSAISIPIKNKGKNIAYWISMQSNSSSAIIYPNQIYKLLPNETKELKVKISANLPIDNRQPIIKKIKLDFVSASGKVTTKEINLIINSPKIKITNIQYEDETIKVSFKNIGTETIKDLEVSLFDKKQTLGVLKPNDEELLTFYSKKPIDKVDINIHKPFYDWSFINQDVKIKSFYIYYIILGLLIIGLLLTIRYYKRYRNSFIMKLENNDNNLMVFELNELSELKEKLLDIGRFEDILKLNYIDELVYDKAIDFTHLNQNEKVQYFSKRLHATVNKEENFYKINLPKNFDLKLNNFLLYIYDSNSKFSHEVENKVFVLSCNTNQEQKFDFDKSFSNYEYSKNKTNGFIIPKQKEITKLLLSSRPKEVLIEILSNHISFQDLSPYTTSGGVAKESLFFGRIDIIRNILNNEYANYFIVGGRQLGKSSLLYALERKYKQNNNIECHYITLNNNDILTPICQVLGLNNDSTIEHIIQVITQKEKRIIFLIDEVDKFVKFDKKNSYTITSVFRKLSQERKASFIMTGFWELYQQITMDYQSPLKNFGELIRLHGLEHEACQNMMVKPLESLGIKYENKEIIDYLIDKCGQRANLIAIMCNKILEKLDNNLITKNHINHILEEGNLDDFLKGWGELSGDIVINTIDRLIIDITIEKENFRLRDVVAEFKKFEFDMFKELTIHIDNKIIEKSLDRLEIAYILKKTKGNYAYVVPLFKEKLLEGDMDILLDGDLDKYQQFIKAKEMLRQNKNFEEILQITMLDEMELKKILDLEKENSLI